MSDTRNRILSLLKAIVVKTQTAIGPFPLSSDTTEQTLQYAEVLARKFGILTGPGSLMPTVTKSIGSTGRDYSTITGWEADLDNSGIYASGDLAVGECYKDSDFNESVTINGGGTIGLSGITLRAAAGQGHTGIAGTGARIVRSVESNSGLITMSNTGRPLTISGLEITTSVTSYQTFGIAMNSGGTSDNKTVVNNIVHGMLNNIGTAIVSGIGAAANNRAYRILNNLVYNIDHSAVASSTVNGITSGAGIYTDYTYGNTVFDITAGSASGSTNAIGISFNDDADFNLKNNLVVTVTKAGSGTANCYQLSSVSNAVVSHNLSSDTTASGTGSLVSKTAANQFVSIVGGSEDLHLKTGADAINAGTDLGTTPTGVNIDIDGRDRDAEGDTWDMGADEFVSTSNPWYWAAAGQSQMIGGGVN